MKLKVKNKTKIYNLNLDLKNEYENWLFEYAFFLTESYAVFLLLVAHLLQRILQVLLLCWWVGRIC